MFEWYSALSLTEQIFVWIAAPASLILIIQTILLFFTGGADSGLDSDVSGLGDSAGIDGGADIDVDVVGGSDTDLLEGSTGAGLQFITTRGIIALLTVFGWAGLCFMAVGLGSGLSIALAAVLGFGALVGVAYLVRALLRLQAINTVNYRLALGRNADVYLTIPAKGQGVGKITLDLDGSLKEYDAVNTGDTPIKTGDVVRVTDLLRENVMVVEKE
ncbi:MAG: hypothetical protein LBR85_02885 [Oscillospiraceae bacterium]|jgi:hypothetical protein|nr:hypothetical protein [Oscillospiraceae bacterium]